MVLPHRRAAAAAAATAPHGDALPDTAGCRDVVVCDVTTHVVLSRSAVCKRGIDQQ